LLTEFCSKRIVCLTLKFSAGDNVLTDTFRANNCEHVMDLTMKCAIVC